jgi:hypothetical protein
MRITINRMRGSLAHKVRSGQAVSRPDENLARHRSELLIWACAASLLRGAIILRLINFALGVARFSSTPPAV